jgi:hypothetical protein
VTFKLKDVDWTKILGRKSPVEKLVEEAEVITEKVKHRRKHHVSKTSALRKDTAD